MPDGLSELLAPVAVDTTCCVVPLDAQMERLRRVLAAHGRGDIIVDKVDLYELEGPDRDTALDAVVACEPSPLVICEGRLLCVGSIDTDAVLVAVGVSSAAPLSSEG